MKHNYDFWNNKLPKGFYDDIFIQGKSNNASLQSSWHNLTFLKIKDYVDESSNLLDYACGPGTFTGNYTNCNSIGFDISPNQIDYANEKYKSSRNIFTTSKSDILERGPFDIITVLGLIEFLSVDEFKKELRFLLDNLKPDGKILFTTPNYAGLMFVLEKVSQIFNSVSYNDVKETNYTSKKVKKLMKNTFSELNLNYKIKKILNFGIIMSIINNSFGIKLEQFIEKVFVNKIGFLLLIEITQNDYQTPNEY